MTERKSSLGKQSTGDVATIDQSNTQESHKTTPPPPQHAETQPDLSLPLDRSVNTANDKSTIEKETQPDLSLPLGPAIISARGNSTIIIEPQDATPTPAPTTEEAAQSDGPPHSIFSERTRKIILITVSFAAFISPTSGNIYWPAINTIAKDLNVSVSLINLTVTTYMIFQGIAPTFIGTFSDFYGRRPAYIVGLSIYVLANIGLALQTNYAALMVLRCLQSTGSSGTIALGSATVSDIVTRAERGKYMMYAQMGITLGPALGPTIGGLLSQFLGWRAIFVFLAIYGGVFLAIIALFLPETCRSVVGNGSLPAQRWNKPLFTFLDNRHKSTAPTPEQLSTRIERKGRPNPLTSITIIRHPPMTILLLVGAVMTSGFFVVLSTNSPILARPPFNLTDLQIGLCYLPYGIGSLTTRWSVGYFVDRNFRRHARLAGVEIKSNRQPDLEKVDIERARGEIAVPFLILGAGFILIYGWLLGTVKTLPGAMVALFFIGLTVSGGFNIGGTLLIDLNRDRPATAMAAQNFFRCLASAGAVAYAVPLTDAIGLGWAGTIVSVASMACIPLMFVLLRNGKRWRDESLVRKEKKEEDEKKMVMEAREKETGVQV